MIHVFFPCLILLLSLPGCFRGQYPQLEDVPEYTPPSISTTQVQKEIEELKAEREPYSSQ